MKDKTKDTNPTIGMKGVEAAGDHYPRQETPTNPVTRLYPKKGIEIIESIQTTHTDRHHQSTKVKTHNL